MIFFAIIHELQARLVVSMQDENLRDGTLPDSYDFPLPNTRMQFTGERYVTGLIGPIQYEHYHRYLFASRFCVGTTVLDIACGEGYGSKLLSHTAKEVFGIDISADAIEFAKENYGSDTLKFLLGDAARIPLPGRSIDVVVSFETIEHLGDHEAFLSEIKRILRPGGCLVISSPNRDCYPTAQPNEFHVRELDREQFRLALQSRFKNVVVFEQRAMDGSVIVAEPSQQLSSEGFENTADLHYRKTIGVPAPHYFVAVAADVDLPNLSNSFLFSGGYWSYLQNAVSKLTVERDHLQTEHHANENELLNAMREIANLQRDRGALLRLAESGTLQGEQLSRVNEQLGALRNDLDILRGEQARLLDLKIEAESRLSQKTDELYALRIDFERLLQSELTARRERTEYEAELSAVRLALENALIEKAHIEAELDDAKTQHDKALLEGTDVGARLETIKSELESTLIERARIEAELESVRGKHEKASAELAEFEAALSNARAKYELILDDKSEVEEKIEDVKSKYELALIERAGIEARLEAANQLVATLADQKAEVAESLSVASRLLERKRKRRQNSLIWRVRNRWRMARVKRAFDEDYYLSTYKDVADAGVDPFVHFMETGWREGRNPRADFSTTDYLASHPGLVGRNANPFVHFLHKGRRAAISENWIDPLRGRWNEAKIKWAFDRKYYLRKNPDVAAAGVDPLTHFLETGWKEGRDPSPSFTTIGYLDAYPDARESGLNPLVHYVIEGRSRGMRPVARTSSAELEPSETIDPVPLYQGEPLAAKPVRLLAFYLPQFHAIPENNLWWGEGFTEWTNVRSAIPQFEGHYQPHVPGELGYYNLLDPGVQARQVELAKLYGIEGFCFYFYWFAGKRLLEKPLENWLSDKSLNLPFCLCWANENWTRRWDGHDNEILIAQAHSADDDLAFIQAVAPYLRDERYIRVKSKPLLIVYRPNLLPSMAETANRWRNWCRENGIGEIHLAYTQSFEESDPAIYGLDAAIEFPPVRPRVTKIESGVRRLKRDFAMNLFDWRDFKRRSDDYADPGYPLYRGVCTNWDNTARRKAAGTVYANGSPELFSKWLANAMRDAVRRFEHASERLIFVNAWNEWAEGAHLEPDQRYGYAWLQATRKALVEVARDICERRVIVVAHDAHPHGAQFLSLHLAQALGKLGIGVDLIVLGEGPLLARYAEFATVHKMDLDGMTSEEVVGQVTAIAGRGASLALVNTAVSGALIPALKLAGLQTVTLVHELPGVLHGFGLSDQAHFIAEQSDKVVFAAPQVRLGFEEFVGRKVSQSVIRPQGLYHRSMIDDRLRSEIQSKIRAKHNLRPESVIVLSVGYGDHRKGLDLFVEVCISLFRQNKDAVAIWVGHYDNLMMEAALRRIVGEKLESRFIFTGFVDKPAPYFAAADIYALTSREDPFPSVVLESLEVGVPAVAFEGAGGIDEILTKDTGLLVPMGDCEKMAEAINGLLRAPDELARLGRNGKLIIEGEFRFSDYVRELLALGGLQLPRISVVVPNYNYARYLRARLDSIARQTVAPFEIIILDDASKDDSLEVITKFRLECDVPTTVLVNDHNSGNVFSQWRKGVSIAKGDLVWIAEADDLCDPTLLAELLPAFSRPDVVMSYCESKQMDGDGSILCDNYHDYVADISATRWRNSYVASGLEEITTALHVKNTIPNVSAVLFRRQSVLNVLLEYQSEIEHRRFVGDWITYLRVLETGAISFTNKSLNHHRRHTGSVTLANHSLSLLNEIIQVQSDTISRYKLNEAARTNSSRYAQELFEQFNLHSESIRDFRDHPDLQAKKP